MHRPGANAPALERRQRKGAWLTAFTFSNAALAILIAATNIPFSADDGWVPNLILALALPGHFLFFGALLALLPWLLGASWPQPRWMVIGAVLLQTGWLCLLLVDARVFALYRFHLNAMVVNLLLGGAFTDQVALSVRTWVLAALAAVAVLGLESLLAYLWWRLLPARSGRGAWCAWVAAVLVMVTGQGLIAYHDARGERAVLSKLTYVPWAQPLTVKDFLRRRGLYVPPTDTPTSGPDPDDTLLAYPRAPLRCDGRPRFNLLMIVVESLRPDMLDPAVMPHTWRYAQRSLVFGRHFSNGSSTRFGLFGLMYGIPGGYWHDALAERRGSVLVDTLARKGYRMHIYGSAPLFNPEFDRTIFASVRDRIAHAPWDLPREERDRYLAARMRRELETAPPDRRFFGFLFLDSPHAPYHLPEDHVSPFQPMADDVDFLTLGPDRDPLPQFNRYRTAVRYTDQLIGQLLRSLERSALAADTVVLITGDHGEEFNELGLNYWTHNGNFSDYQLRTLFVLHWPGRPPRHVDHLTTHEDVVPTLMRHLLDCRNPVGDYATGRDLFGPNDPNRIWLVESWSQRGIRHGERTYLFDEFGNASVLDARYRPLPAEKPDPRAVREAWEMLTRFRKGGTGQQRQ